MRSILVSMFLIVMTFCAAPSRAGDGDAVLREMVGQMILIGFPGTLPQESGPRRVGELVREGRIGGVVLFADNVVDPPQLRALTAAISGAARDLPPFIAVDQEGGAVQWLTGRKGFAGLPSAARIADLDRSAAYGLYRRTAFELAGLGINVNFGPVVDLALNPQSPIIAGIGRSYDRDPRKVIAYARQFIDAHQQAGILTSAKHFPGHGSARGDTHESLVDISATWREAELEPFRDLIGDEFAAMIMVGHLVHPRFSDGGGIPASLSRRTIDGVLRGELGFRGLVVTDDLDMGAVRDRYSVERAAVLAVKAGADLLVVANKAEPDLGIAERIAAAILRAVAAGEIDVREIERSYGRIVRAKAGIGERQAVAR